MQRGHTPDSESTDAKPRMPDRYTKRILEHVGDQRYRPRHPRDLATDLGVPEDEHEAFRQSVQRLVDAGHLIWSDASTIVLPPPGRDMTGVFRLNERGFGFLVPDSPTEHGDLFVPEGNTGGALTGDRVRAKVIHVGSRGEGKSPYIGKVVDIIQRAEKRYVGNLTKRGSGYVVELDGRVFNQPVIVRDPHAKNAKLGDKVVVELLEYPREDAPAEGVISEVLGEQGEPAVETLAVMRSHGLPDKFPEEVIEEARRAAHTFKGDAIPPDREDLTRDFICTIDPPDAKDFDDAISIHELDPEQNGGAVWELGVHIADVSHFVKLGTALDAEARERGNSVYLPRKVVPMLPELLSNGVCSLQEGVNRFCKSAFIRYDEDGRPVGQRFANTVIRSAKRMTYLEAQALIDGDIREARRHARSEQLRYSPQLTETVQKMDRLARLLRERRLRDGMIVLGLPKAELVFDDSGRVIDAQPEDDAFTHTIIEMFMVEANEAVARLFHSLSVPMIRRIHPDPDAHDIGELRQFARVAGINIPMRPSRKELQHLLEGTRGKPAQHAVHLAVLKTLSRAEYSPLTIGHFALASEHYTHFTSPIRRYPDLVVHRGLDAFFDAAKGAGSKAQGPAEGRASRGRHPSSLQGPGPSPLGPVISQKMLDDDRCPSEEQLTDLGRHTSSTERNAQDAENELRTYLVLDLLSQQLGEDYEGTVTGVTGGGVFVQIDRYLVDGFVKVNDLPGLPNDRWRLNRNTGSLVAQRSGKSVTIGDRFRVRIAKVNPVARQMDLWVVSEPAKKKTEYPRKHKKVAPKAPREGEGFKRQKKAERRANQGPRRRRRGR